MNDLVQKLFKFLCIVTAGVMVGYWFYKFQKNEDVSLIDYKTFKDAENAKLPEMNFCVIHPFYDIKLDNISRGLNAAKYVKYLQGRFPVNKTYEGVNYDEVTVDLYEYLRAIKISWKNKTNIRCQNLKKCPYVSFKNTYNGFW